ncbi:MAG: lysoplasmalogenase [Clostridia bacterium]|nr:lysoplasmalogenase [Clostridia bacterium]
MVFIIIFVLAALLEIIFVPLFLKASWPDRCWKSLGYKMICASLFLIAGLCCILYSGGFTKYARLMFLGLLFGALGDLLIHFITKKAIINVFGGVAFFVGHIFYIAAFFSVLSEINPQARLFNLWSVVATLVYVAAYLCFAYLKKVKIGVLTVPVIFYALMIVTMLMSAIKLALSIGTVGAYCTLLLGAALFVSSDTTLSLFTFGGEKFRKKGLKNFYIITYFLAQFLLGASVVFVK